MPDSDTIYTTEKDVAYDTLAALDMFVGSFGSDETVIEDVFMQSTDSAVIVVLDNGDRYELTVRSI